MIVVLFVADTLRADAPGFAGGPANTPFIDSLAATGAWFDSMFAAASWTVPSLMSMLTGSLGHRIGVCRWRHPFPARRPTLFTAFASAGFDTMCLHPYPEWGLLTVAGRTRSGNSQDPDAVCRALAGAKGQDRFVFVLHWWTHLPYINREMPRDKWHLACDYSIDSLRKHPEKIAASLAENYRRSVNYLSETLLPRYLEAAASNGEDVLFALTGDHGETWGASWPPGKRIDHVYDLHGRWIADETIRVPFLLHGKTPNGSIPTGRLGGLISGVDIGPTVADLAGIDWPGPIPQNAGPGMVERGDELNMIGVSRADCVRNGKDTDCIEILTLSSHNTREPRTYPPKGPDMWRTFALRDRAAWYVYDGVSGEKQVTPLGDDSPSEQRIEQVMQRLAEERGHAVDSAPMVPDEDVTLLRGDQEQVRRRLQDLGYLD